MKMGIGGGREGKEGRERDTENGKEGDAWRRRERNNIG